MRNRNGAAISPSPNPTDDWIQDPMATSAKAARAAAGSSGKDSGVSCDSCGAPAAIQARLRGLRRIIRLAFGELHRRIDVIVSEGVISTQ
jgi:hypothetical protein